MNERGHPAHRVRSVTMARLDQKLGVRAHERHGHRHLRAVRQHELRSIPKLLDDAEDVVPPDGIQTTRVLAKLVENLLHLERREDRLEQNGGVNRAARDSAVVLREVEYVVPQPRLEMALELGPVSYTHLRAHETRHDL